MIFYNKTKIEYILWFAYLNTNIHAYIHTYTHVHTYIHTYINYTKKGPTTD